ncbi:hypothetical protein AA0119_g12664 [Alternaria tenuissima]|uniref:Uncharacterized protein n=1 Tax=Alternaria tenuissima TaxID=119927 RepID=A0ABY0FQM1_9PLEO|nr:hypothetical protein AA0120_g12254 [Alternaria tenuissima]RYN86679.1 hypothetical protein AA0119_g12664 [Alternaria tenuissima]RYO04409.1 hypothetical protein AA0121_g12781 [Alternaria tenuissima]
MQNGDKAASADPIASQREELGLKEFQLDAWQGNKVT